MENINDVLNGVELEREEDRIILIANIASDYYNRVLNAFFKYTSIVEDTLNGKKRYVSDLGTFSYFQLAYGEISKFNGQLQEKADDGKDNIIVVKEEVIEDKKEKKTAPASTEEVVSEVYRDLKANTVITLSINSDIDSTEKFLNYMGTSLFDSKNSYRRNENVVQGERSFEEIKEEKSTIWDDALEEEQPKKEGGFALKGLLKKIHAKKD